MSKQGRRKFDSNFKRNAVSLNEESGRTVAELARNLGIRSELLYRLRQQMRESKELAFPGHGKMFLTQDQKGIRELENNSVIQKWSEIF